MTSDVESLSKVELSSLMKWKNVSESYYTNVSALGISQIVAMDVKLAQQ